MARMDYLRARAHVEEMLVSSFAERTNRRGLTTDGLKLVTAGGLAVAAFGGGRFVNLAAAQDDAEEDEEATDEETTDEETSDDESGSPFADDIEILNYALTLEHIEATFYRIGGETFADQDYLNIGFQAAVREYVAEIGSNEADHVATLTQVITDLGGDPVAEAEYEFPYTDLTSFLAFGQAVEDLGVGAYGGAAQFIENLDLLTAALTIHGNEARHAAYLALLNTASPFPAAFDQALLPDAVLEVAGPLIVS